MGLAGSSCLMLVALVLGSSCASCVKDCAAAAAFLFLSRPPRFLRLVLPSLSFVFSPGDGEAGASAQFGWEDVCAAMSFSFSLNFAANFVLALVLASKPSSEGCWPSASADSSA